MNRFLLKIQVIFLFLLLKIPDLFSQAFVEQTDIVLPGVSNSSVSWGDYDNDGDLDIILTGSYSTRIYKNNGNNTFSEQTSISLTGVSIGSVAWGDYDNDNDLDILITGRAINGYISKIYRNNGNNTFTEQTTISLIGVQSASVDWGDYDNDGDLDIILTGFSNQRISKIYRNNGNNSFTEQSDIVLTGVMNGSAVWGDYDNDGDLDILLTGSPVQGLPTSIIYNNNGDNNFSLQNDIVLTGVVGMADWGDYDNDGNLDILLTGSSISGPVSKIYHNNGDSTFTEQASIILIGVEYSSVAWGDCNNDGNLDILITGSSSSGSISKIFLNDGDNTFSEQTKISLTGVTDGSAVFGDYDNDGDLDILLTGSGIAKIYRNEINVPNMKPEIPSNLHVEINNNTVNFIWDKVSDSETSQNGLSYNLYVYESGQSIYKCSPHSFKQSDIKNGRRLIAKSGNIQWRQTGYLLKDLPPDKTYYWTVQAIDAGMQGGSFSEEQSFTMPFYRPVTQASCISFSNIQSTQVTAIWAQGGGTKRVVFIKDTLTGIVDPIDSVTYNINDSTPDGWKCVYNGTSNSVIINGLIPNTVYSVQVCEYNGTSGCENYLRYSSYHNPVQINTILTEQSSISLPNVERSYVCWGDYNNDGYLDLLITGGSSSGNISKIFKNNGDNTFTEQTSITLTGVWMGSSAWGDYDNDGDLDILLTGSSNLGYTSKVYRNNGNNSFTEQTTILLPIAEGSSFWADFDNDGDLDILLKGFTSSSNSILKSYRNDNDGAFVEQTKTSFPVEDLDGTITIGDYDNDNDPDIFITSSFRKGAIIYRNDGDFNFTEQAVLILGDIYGGSIACGDYNNDGYLDIFVTGLSNSSSGNIAKIFRNTGNNTFVEETNISLEDIGGSSCAWGDYNNDGFLDIIMSGSSNLGLATIIYHNNGNNTFDKQTGIYLTGVDQSSVAWGDYDNDNDLDLILTGASSSSRLSKIYRNEILNSNIKPSTPGGLQSNWDADRIIFKWNKSSDNTTPQNGITYNLRIGTTPGGNQVKSGQALPTGKLLFTTTSYLLNDTSFSIKLPCNKYYWTVQAVDKGGLAGSFATEQFTFSDSIQTKNLRAFIKTSNSLLIRWTNGNGLRRVVFARISSPTGTALPINGTIYHAEPYYGKGDKIGTTGWFCVYNGQADSTTIYGLGEGYSYDIQAIEYIEITGTPKYFRTVGNGNPGVFSTTIFSEHVGISLIATHYGSSSWGDYDNDGDLDILLTGATVFAYTNAISKIYRNNGNNTFSEQTEISLKGVCLGSVAWGDYDNDNYLDILLTGSSEYVPISKIYHNNGNNTFTELTNISLTGVIRSAISWGDYDNDDDLDILLTGSTDFSSANPISKIYRNDGNNVFTEQTGITLPGVFNGSADWGDFNNDGYLDILLAGWTESGTTIKLYLNNRDNTFFEQSSAFSTMVPDSITGPATWSDYDNDDDIDIYIGRSGRSKVYRNNGKNTFIEQSNIKLIEVGWTGVISAGDFDNDGYLDLYLISYNSGVSKIYHNNGYNTFTELSGVFLIGGGLSSMCGDYDNDGDLDLLLGCKVYNNNTFMKAGIYPLNKKPAAPTNLSVKNLPQGTMLSWSPVKGDETPYKTMTYNVQVIEAQSGSNICSYQSDSVSGYRRIVAMGNAQLDTTFLLKDLSTTKFYWKVQAVDQGYQGRRMVCSRFIRR